MTRLPDWPWRRSLATALALPLATAGCVARAGPATAAAPVSPRWGAVAVAFEVVALAFVLWAARRGRA